MAVDSEFAADTAVEAPDVGWSSLTTEQVLATLWREGVEERDLRFSVFLPSDFAYACSRGGVSESAVLDALRRLAVGRLVRSPAPESPLPSSPAVVLPARDELGSPVLAFRRSSVSGPGSLVLPPDLAASNVTLEMVHDRLVSAGGRPCLLLPPVVRRAVHRYRWYSAAPPSTRAGCVWDFWHGQRLSDALVEASVVAHEARVARDLTPAPARFDAEEEEEGGSGRVGCADGEGGGRREAAGGREEGSGTCGAAAGTPSSSASPGPTLRRRVAVLGGSFHPVTNAHLQLAAEVLWARAVDEVWIIPCGARPDKPSLAVPVLERLVETMLGVEEFFPETMPVSVAPAEVFTASAVPSYRLLVALGELIPHVDFSLLIGADLLPTLHRWAFADRLLRHVHFLCLPRPGAPDPRELYRAALEESAASPTPTFPRSLAFLDIEPAAIADFSLSSTLVRDRLARAGPADARPAEDEDRARLRRADGLVPRAVLRRIFRGDLYLDR